MKTAFGLLVLLLAFVPLLFVYSAGAEDTASPVINCPSDLTLACGQATDPVHIGAPSAADDSSEVCLHFADEVLPGACPAAFTIHRAWTAADPSGNASTCTQTISVNDAAPPVLTCPDDVTVACDGSIDPCATGRATATDTCGGNASSCNEGLLLHYSFNVNEGGTVSDLSGHARNGTVSGATFTPNGIQGGAYSFDGVDDFIETCDAGLPDGDKPRSIALWVKFNQTTPDIEHPFLSYGSAFEHVLPNNQWVCLTLDRRVGRNNIAMTQDGGVYVSAAPIAPGEWYHVVYTYNSGGNHRIYINGSDSFQLSEIGALHTVLSGQFRLGRQSQVSSPAIFNGWMDEVRVYDRTLSVDEVHAMYTGACPNQGVAIHYQDSAASGECSQVISRTWRAIDACGNSSQCVQTIAVVDSIPPQISIPPDRVVECGSATDPEHTGGATASDTCCHHSDPDNGLVLHYTFDGGPAGATQDKSGHGNDGTLIGATIVPNGVMGSAASFDGNDYIRIGDLPQSEGQMNLSWGAWIFPTGTGLDAVVAKSQSGNAVFLLNIRGSQSHINAEVTVGQDTGRSIQHYGTLQLNAWQHIMGTYDGSRVRLYRNGILLGTSPDYPPQATRSNNVIATVGESSPGRGWLYEGLIDEVRVYQRTLTADEILALYTQEQDGQPDCPVTLTHGDEITGDHCTTRIHRTWTATDACGNTARGVQTITQTDTTAPELTCPADVTVACNAPIDPCATGRATATDACGGDAAPCNDGLLLYYSFDTNEGAAVSDLSGHARNGTVNGATFTPGGIQGGACSFDGVDDFIETCDAGFPDGDKPRSLALWVNFSDINPQDEEFVASYGSPNEHVSPDNQWNALCLDTRAGRQHMAFTQDGGVYVSAATITAGQWVHVVHTYNGNNSHKIYINGAESFEQNELFGSLNTILSGRFMLGAHVDMQPGKPLFGGLMDEVRVYGRALSAAEVQDLYTQPCPASQAALSYQDTAVAEGCPRVIERMWTATDACGNTASCAQRITVLDATTPILNLSVPPDVTVECTDDTSSAATGMATGSSTCGDVTMAESDASVNGCGATKTITRTWIAADACGNTASASQVITVADTSPPELLGVPADTALPCGATIPPLPEVTAYDNCDGTVAVLISGDIGIELPVYPLAGTSGGGCEQIITRTWTATDACGNSVSDSQTITIQDTTPPELSGVPDDLTVACNQVPAPPTVTATDNCCHPPPAVDALLLHYAFDTDEGGVVSDLSGHGHHGIPYGAVWTPAGKYSGAYAFDGDADYIDLGPTDAYAPPAGQLSAASWIYMQDREITILSNYHGGPGYSGQFFFIVDADGIFNVILGQGPGQYLRYLATKPDIIPLNEWHHVAFSYDESRGEGNKIKLYVDGKDIGQYLIASEGTGGPVLQIGEHLRAMAHGTGTNSRPGMLDELRIYQSALSPEEVMQLFREKPAACAPTIDFLETDDGQDCPRIITRIWTATDACGNSTSLSQIIVALQDPALDSDGDTIPDAWEFRYSGSVLALSAEEDPDNDGFDNLSEYIADTDPFDGASFFNQEHLTHNSPAMFHFLSSAQRVYTLEYSLDLNQVPWQPVPEQLRIPGTGGMMTLTDTRDFENCSYRILAELP